jgi:hypothetical protein
MTPRPKKLPLAAQYEALATEHRGTVASWVRDRVELGKMKERVRELSGEIGAVRRAFAASDEESLYEFLDRLDRNRKQLVEDSGAWRMWAVIWAALSFLLFVGLIVSAIHNPWFN